MGYARNIGRSFTYALGDSVANINPNLITFADRNIELGKQLYGIVRDYKGTTSKIKNKVVNSDLYEFASSYRKNLLDDIKTGKFYNKEREELINNKMFSNGFDDDWDLSDLDIDDSDAELTEEEERNSRILEGIDTVGEKMSGAIGTMTAKSAEYTVAGFKDGISVLFKQHERLMSGVTIGLAAINSNISNITTIMQPITAHITNSTKFFENTTNYQQQVLSLLGNIYTSTQYNNTPSPTTQTIKKDYDYVYSGGIPDISRYFEAISNNVSNQLSSITQMNKMFGENTNMLMTFASSPLSGLIKMATNKLIPDTIKASMQLFDKHLEGFFSSSMMRLYEFRNSENPILKTLGNIFGLDSKYNTTLDTSKYEKGRVPFDGITRKSVIEVIPTLLSKILSAINGEDEKRYDYDKGRFINLEEIKTQYDETLKSSALSAASDILGDATKYMDYISFSSLDQKERIQKEMNDFFVNLYKEGKTFQYNDSSLMGADYGVSDDTFNYLREVFRINNEIGEGYKALQLNDKILKGRISDTNKFSDMQTAGDSIYTNLYNNSMDNNLQYKNDIINESFIKNVNINKILDNKGHNIFFYLQNYYSVLNGIANYISTNGLRNNGGLNRYSNSSRNGLSLVDVPIGDIPRSKIDIERDDHIIEEERYNNNRVKQEDVLKEKGFKLISGEKLIDDSDETRSILRENIILDKLIQKEEKPKTITDKLFDKLRNSDTIGDKFKTVYSSIQKLYKKPTEWITSALDKVDMRIYQLIYGKGPNDDKTSFINKMISELHNTFGRFNTFLDEKILNPLAEKYDIHNFKDLFFKTFETFGIDIKSITNDIKTNLFGPEGPNGKRTGGILSELKDGIKNEFKNAYSWVKSGFKDLFSPIIEKVKDRFPGFGLFKHKSPEDVPQAYTGGKVLKTGIAAVSEGELIIPSELNPFYTKKINKKEEDRREQDSIYKFFGKYSEGGIINDNGVAIVDNAPYPQLQNIINKGLALKDSMVERGEEFKEKYIANNLITENVLSSINDVFTRLFGDPDKNNKTDISAIKEVGNDLFSKNYGASAITGGLIGAGASLLTGMIGGPLLGAAAGSAIALINKSESLNKFLFGEEKEDGNYEGGAFGTKFSNFIKKEFPTYAKFGVTGALTSLLPFVPGGPISGLILGSAFAYAKQSNNVRDYLFGSEGLLGEDTDKKIKEKLPAMGIGALGGMVFGPFGFLTNTLLGSAIGFAADTEKVKDLFFGLKNDKGERVGGVLGVVRDNIIDPLKEFTTDTFFDLRDYFKTKILDPIGNSIKPLLRQTELVVEGVFEKMGNIMASRIEKSLGMPFANYIGEKIIKPIVSGTTETLSTLLKPAKSLLSLPFKGLQAIGTHYKIKQIKEGTADYMSASERLAFRDENKFKFLRKDKNREFDEMISNMDKDQLSQLQKALGLVDNSSNYAAEGRKVLKQTANTLTNDMGYDTAKSVMKLIKNNNENEALKLINVSNLSEERKKELFGYVSKQIQEYNTFQQGISDATHVKNVGYRQLRELGLENFEKNMSKRDLSHIQRLVGKEYNLRGEKELDPTQQEKDRSQKSLEVLEKIEKQLEGIRLITDPVYRKKKEKDLEEKNKKQGFKFESDEKGRLIKFRIGKDGDWKRDDSDSQTKETVKEQEHEKSIMENIEENTSPMKKITGVFDRIRGWFDDKKENEEDTFGERLKIFGKFLLKAGLITSVGGAIGKRFSLNVLPQLKSWWSNDLVPYFKNDFGPNIHNKIDEFLPKFQESPIGKAIINIAEGVQHGVSWMTNTAFPWMTDSGQFKGKGLVSTIQAGADWLIPTLVDGFAWSIEHLSPILIKSLIATLPKLLKGAAVAIGDVMSWSWSKMFGSSRSINNIDIGKSSGLDNISIPDNTNNISSNIKGSKLDTYINNRTIESPESIVNKFMGISVTPSEPAPLEDVKSAISTNNVENNQKLLFDTLVSKGIETQDAKALSSVANDNSKDINEYLDNYYKAKFNIDKNTSYEDSKKILSNVNNSGYYNNNDRYKTAMFNPLDNNTSMAEMLGNASIRSIMGKGGTIAKGAGSILKGISSGVTGITSLIPGAKTASKFVNKLVGSGVDTITNGYSTISNLGSRLSNLSSGLDNVGRSFHNLNLFSGNLADDVLGSTGMNLADNLGNSTNSGLVKKLCNLIKECIDKICNSKIIKKVLKSCTGNNADEVAKLALKVADKISNSLIVQITKKAAKVAGSVLTKAIAILSNPITIAITALADFAWGMDNAESILGVTECDTIETLIAGFINFLTQKFTLGIIPASTIVDIGISVGEMIGVDMSGIKDRQEEAAQKLLEWNAAHPDEQYDDITTFLQKDSISTKIKTGISNAWNSTKSTVSNAWNSVKSGAISLANNTKDIVGNVIDKSKDIFFGTTSINSNGEEIKFKGIANSMFDALNAIKDGNIKKYWTLDKNEFGEGTQGKITYASSLALRFLMSPLASVGIVISKAWNGLKSIATEVKEFPSTYSKYKNIVDEYSSAGKLNGYWDIGTSLDSTDSSGNPLGKINNMAVFFAKLFGYPSTLMHSIGNWVGNKISGLLNSFVDFNKTLFKYDNDIDIAANNGDLSSLFSIGKTETDMDINGNPIGGFTKFMIGVKKTASIPKALFNNLFIKIGSIMDPYKSKGLVWFDDYSKVFDPMVKSNDSMKSTIDKIWGTNLNNGEKDNPFSPLNNFIGAVQKVLYTIRTVFDRTLGKVGDLANWAGDKWANLTGTKGTIQSANFVSSAALNGSGSFVSQLDSSISNKKYSNGTIGSDGCGPAVASMALAKYGKSVDITSAAKYAENNGYTGKGTSANYFQDILSKQGISSKYINPKISGQGEIYNRIKSGQPTILLGQDTSNKSKVSSPFGPGNHYVLASGMDKKGNILVNDPELKRPKLYNNKILNNVKLGISTMKGSGSLLQETASIIGAHEGSYDSVNPNDNGALSIGKIQWHGSRAKNLLQLIENNKSGILTQYLPTSLYSDVTSKPDTYWNTRIVNSSEKNSLTKLLGTDVSKNVQNSLIAQDIEAYYSYPKSKGISDPQVLMYFADCYNQSPSAAIRILDTAINKVGNQNGVNIDVLHQVALADKTLGKYSSRRNSVYNKAKSITNFSYDPSMESYGISNMSTSALIGGQQNANITSEASTTNTLSGLFSKLLGIVLNGMFGEKAVTTISDFLGLSMPWTTSASSNTPTISSAEYMSMTGQIPYGEAVAQKAAEYVDKVNYVYGARDLDNKMEADCSGFTQQIYKKFGYSDMAPTVTTQDKDSRFTRIDSVKNLMPGDLVMFENNDNPADGCDHIGIYYGNNKFVHSPRTGRKVSFDDLSTPYYQRVFDHGKRVPAPTEWAQYNSSTMNNNTSSTTPMTDYTGRSIDDWNTLASSEFSSSTSHENTEKLAEKYKDVATQNGWNWDYTNNKLIKNQNSIMTQDGLLMEAKGSQLPEYTEKDNTNIIDTTLLNILNIIVNKLAEISNNTLSLDKIIKILEGISIMKNGNGSGVESTEKVSAPSVNKTLVVPTSINNSTSTDPSNQTDIAYLVNLLSKLAM